MFLHKIIYLLGRDIRNKRMKYHEKELMSTDFSDINTLQELQLKRLKKLFKHAKENSKFYEQRLKNIDVETMTLDVLKDLSVLTKEEFRDNIGLIQNYIPNEKYFRSSTSGSSGKALLFDRNLDWDAATRAAQVRAFSWYGVKPWMKNLYFWGYNPNWKALIKIRFMDFLVNRYRVFTYNEKTMKKIKKHLDKCEYIEGYSSSIYSLAQKAEGDNYTNANIKMIKGTSEKIYDSYQEPMKNVFNQKMISEYGAAETGIIAFECPEGNMHIAMENVIVEEIENKIIVTNLFSKSAPIIRYELGDYAEFDFEKKCKCGREHQIIKEVTGRIGNKIFGYKDEYPSLVIYYIFKNIVQRYNLVMSYYACQSERGRLLVKVIYEGEDLNVVRTYINNEKNSFFDSDLDIQIEFITKLENNFRKTQSFESYINKNNQGRCQ